MSDEKLQKVRKTKVSGVANNTTLQVESETTTPKAKLEKAFEAVNPVTAIDDHDPDIVSAENRNLYLKTKPMQHWNKKGLSEAEAGIESIDMIPGKLEMKAKVKLHTKLTINLFRGRQAVPEKNIRGIIGLARFARQTALVWSAAAIDDPYADQCLIDIETAWNDARNLIEARTKSLKELLNGMEDFEVETQASINPVTIELNFYSPWGYRGALLLRDLDKLILLAMTGKHIGLILDSDWDRIVTDSLRAVRHMFAEVLHWRHTAVTRQDLLTNNKVAQRAKQKYLQIKQIKAGYLDLSRDVFDGNLRAELSPQNRVQETAKRLQQERDAKEQYKLSQESAETE